MRGVSQNGLSSIDEKIKMIEAMLKENQDTLDLIRETVKDVANGDQDSLRKLQKMLQMTGRSPSPAPQWTKMNAAEVALPDDTCRLMKMGASEADIHVCEFWFFLSVFGFNVYIKFSFSIFVSIVILYPCVPHIQHLSTSVLVFLSFGVRSLSSSIFPLLYDLP